MAMKRYPDGVEGKHFLEKQCPPWRPDWVSTASVWTERKKRDVDYCVIDDGQDVHAARLTILATETIDTGTQVAHKTVLAALQIGELHRQLVGHRQVESRAGTLQRAVAQRYRLPEAELAQLADELYGVDASVIRSSTWMSPATASITSGSAPRRA
jgi:hypothetical protein